MTDRKKQACVAEVSKLKLLFKVSQAGVNSHIFTISILFVDTSVADPHQYVSGPPGSRSISMRLVRIQIIKQK